jgi:hypothetical protein
MATERQNMSEQEISMKAREHELYVRHLPESDGKVVKPFEVYLKETPAVPFSSATKGILVVVSIIVGLLFLGAIWRAATHHSQTPARTKKVPSAATALKPETVREAPTYVSISDRTLTSPSLHEQHRASGSQCARFSCSLFKLNA